MYLETYVTAVPMLMYVKFNLYLLFLLYWNINVLIQPTVVVCVCGRVSECVTVYK